jgi:hypothetical protein
MGQGNVEHMTITDDAKAELVAQLLADPDFLDTLRTATRARAERPFFNMAGQRIGVNPLVATGRVQVSPGQTISSASWGNPVWDQSINVFADAPSRDSQWPSPHEGSECYTLDTGSPWAYRSGAWRGRPKGFVASATGPASQIDCPSGGATLVSLSPTLVAGRKYLVAAYCSGTQTTATGSNIVTVGGVDMGSPRMWTNTNDAAGNARAGAMSMMVTPVTTGPRALNITGLATAGVFRVVANTCELSVTDIGSA